MSEEADRTLADFKGIKSNYWLMDIPAAHYGSHLYNFKNVYSGDTGNFWPEIQKLTKTMMTKPVEKCPRNVFLCGQAGSGKTHYQIGLYRGMLQNIGFAGGGGVLFRTFMGMVAEVIAGFSENISIREALSYYMQNRWVFLDDFTASDRVADKDKMEHQLFRDILLNRWDTAKTLVASTNLDAGILRDQLRDLFGNHIDSRLSDSVIIQFPDEDMRKLGFGGHGKERP